MSKPRPPGVLTDVVHNRGFPVDGRRAELFDGVSLGCRIGREHLGAVRAGELDCHLADTAGTVDEYLLTGLDLGAVNQPFPRGDDDQRNRSCFSHAKRRRLARQQVRVHRGEFCQRAL
jgi:hypothetical protein